MDRPVQYTATRLQGRNCYAVRPAKQLGTCGWYPVPWVVEYITYAELLRRGLPLEKE